MDENRDDIPRFTEPEEEIESISRALEHTNSLAVERINRETEEANRGQSASKPHWW